MLVSLARALAKGPAAVREVALVLDHSQTPSSMQSYFAILVYLSAHHDLHLPWLAGEGEAPWAAEVSEVVAAAVEAAGAEHLVPP
mmetsp:Transcript_11883/g.21214  ORF Transcript_11883/g.21214 Transcript_11883/m.21214 type:complete len:85 (-) Transcript_11883:343-597(-)